MCSVWKYVLPAMLSHVCFSLFSIVDGVFVGNGVGTNALGAIGLVMPFVNAICALMMLINVGGATIFAIQVGKKDTASTNDVFRHGMLLLAGVSAIFSIAGVFFAGPLCTLFGAGDTFHGLATENIFSIVDRPKSSEKRMSCPKLYGQNNLEQDKLTLNPYYRLAFAHKNDRITVIKITRSQFQFQCDNPKLNYWLNNKLFSGHTGLFIGYSGENSVSSHGGKET